MEALMVLRITTFNMTKYHPNKEHVLALQIPHNLDYRQYLHSKPDTRTPCGPGFDAYGPKQT